MAIKGASKPWQSVNHLWVKGASKPWQSVNHLWVKGASKPWQSVNHLWVKGASKTWALHHQQCAHLLQQIHWLQFLTGSVTKLHGCVATQSFMLPPLSSYQFCSLHQANTGLAFNILVSTLLSSLHLSSNVLISALLSSSGKHMLAF